MYARCIIDISDGKKSRLEAKKSIILQKKNSQTAKVNWKAQNFFIKFTWLSGLCPRPLLFFLTYWSSQGIRNSQKDIEYIAFLRSCFYTDIVHL